MLNTILTGLEFNQQYGGKKFVKLTNRVENHNGYQFQTGLNVDSIPFNPKGQCRPGGIYFCLLEKIHLWLNYDIKSMIYARLVTIPDDARIYIETDKFKADRLILGERQKIGDLEQWKDPLYCLEAVREDGHALKFVVKQTEAVCLEAVKQEGNNLMHVLEQTREICLAAINNNTYALAHVKDQTPELCLKAIEQSPDAVHYVKDQSKELCLEAIRQDPLALEYVKNQTPELCMEAVRQDPLALRYVKDQTPELCMEAIRGNPLAWRHVREQTDELCRAAGWAVSS